MKTNFHCIPCIMRQTINAVDLAVEDDAIRRKAINAILAYLQDIDYNTEPPAIGREVNRLLVEITGNKDPFRHIKVQYNKVALALMDNMRRLVFQNPDPVQTAAKLAVAGNIIDFKAGNRETHLKAISDNIGSLNFEINHFEKFLDDLKSARTILYLADNAGEIVFDRLFIEMVQRYYPELGLQFTVMVRGQPVMNDATREDALMVGLDQIARVVDNGDSAPATILPNISDEARQIYEQADLVISKGVGNYEALDEETRLIYYLLRIDCPLTSVVVNAGEGNLVFKRNENYKVD